MLASVGFQMKFQMIFFRLSETIREDFQFVLLLISSETNPRLSRLTLLVNTGICKCSLYNFYGLVVDAL